MQHGGKTGWCIQANLMKPTIGRLLLGIVLVSPPLVLVVQEICATGSGVEQTGIRSTRAAVGTVDRSTTHAAVGVQEGKE